ncbi:hypothetical protein [Pseudoalteromonas sp. McH1-42]|uniref:hypothetical protein n=1 Tax=Pseudoalteromonas sp. McH1-42 TaxID=2917752 RepID=UPI001EF4F5D4|nr:hypothetical protein [Pseudoalteromonas sp. McH1-42]MCG7560301.1 hypothetical protein [Pseudoalteromonas sp. McH1-42]
MAIQYEKTDLVAAQAAARDFVNGLSEGLAARLVDDMSKDKLSLEGARHLLAEAITRRVLTNYNKGGEGRDSSDDWEGPVDIEAEVRALKSNGEANPNELYEGPDALALAGMSAGEMGFYLADKRETYERLVNTVGASVGDAANALYKVGVISVGEAASKKAFSELVKTKSVRKAIVAGVKAVGTRRAVVAIGLVLAAILIYFIVTNEKNFYGVVLNLTETNLNCADHDRFMYAGTLVSFPLDKEDGVNADAVNIRGGSISFDDEGNDVEAYYAGTYFAEKKIGLFGAEGMFSLTPKGKSSPNLAILFSCPYSANNGVNLETNIRGSQLSDNWSRLHRARGARKVIEQNGIHAESTVDSVRGSTPIGLTVIRKFDA